MAFLCIFMLVGCVTAGGLNTPEAQEAKRILARGCISIRTGDASMGGYGDPGTKHVEDSIFVSSIGYGEDDWRSVSYSQEGWGFTSYFNKRTGELFCSSKRWRAEGMDSRIRFKSSP